jgi:hypothetical protein
MEMLTHAFYFPIRSGTLTSSYDVRLPSRCIAFHVNNHVALSLEQQLRTLLGGDGSIRGGRCEHVASESDFRQLMNIVRRAREGDALFDLRFEPFVHRLQLTATMRGVRCEW